MARGRIALHEVEVKSIGSRLEKLIPPPKKKFFNVEFGNLGAMFGFHRIDLQKI